MTTTNLGNVLNFSTGGEYKAFTSDNEPPYLNVITSPTLVDGQVYVRDADNPDKHLAIIGVGNKVTQHVEYFTTLRDKIPTELGNPTIKSFTSRGGLWHMEQYVFDDMAGIVHSINGGKTNLSLQMLAFRSVDGKTSNTIATSMLSSWCMNTQLFNVVDGSQKHKAKNTKNFNLGFFIGDVTENAIVFNRVIQEQQRLAQLKISEQTRKTLIEKIIPSERINRRMIELANDNANYWGDTAYAIVNGFTNYASYADERNGFTLNSTNSNLDNSQERMLSRKVQVQQWMNTPAFLDAVAVA
tara:strand:+ start:65 stop:961 length:897 start_codon:yes stop_codon:yes gene_type:complete